MLTFESIEWDYSYESDRVVTYVDHNKYPNTPLKHYPYSYIRAQRRAYSGSADVRLIRKKEKPRFSRATSAFSAASAFSQGTWDVATRMCTQLVLVLHVPMYDTDWQRNTAKTPYMRPVDLLLPDPYCFEYWELLYSATQFSLSYWSNASVARFSYSNNVVVKGH